jgi:hypothetical protein
MSCQISRMLSCDANVACVVELFCSNEIRSPPGYLSEMAQGTACNFARKVRKVCPRMTLDEARESIISGINYAAYRETDFSLHDSDMNRLFGAEHYKSARPVYEPSAWAVCLETDS